MAAGQGSGSSGEPEHVEGQRPKKGWPSKSERKGKRSYAEDGSVRPADGRWKLYEPGQKPPKGKRKRR
jgi:hypothetical protein